MQCAQSDDRSRHAGLRQDPLTRKPRRGNTTAGLFAHQRGQNLLKHVSDPLQVERALGIRSTVGAQFGTKLGVGAQFRRRLPETPRYRLVRQRCPRWHEPPCAPQGSPVVLLAGSAAPCIDKTAPWRARQTALPRCQVWRRARRRLQAPGAGLSRAAAVKASVPEARGRPDEGQRFHAYAFGHDNHRSVLPVLSR